MSTVSYVNAHCKAFFTASLLPSESDCRQSLLADATTLSTACLYPLNLLGKNLWGSTSTFLFKRQNIIPLEKLPEAATPLRVYLFAVEVVAKLRLHRSFEN